MSKELKEKAINIKGKSYVLVSDRVIFFNENFMDGCITTELIRWEEDTIVIKATVYPEGVGVGKRFFTGYAQETVGDGYINKTSALENAETSAVGRALGFMGIGVIDGVCSVDEIRKAEARSMPEAPKYKDGGRGQCLDCGANMVMSAKGNVYCSAKCWLKKARKAPVKSKETPTPEPPPYDYKDDTPF
jgi:hypothetical protein